jgi:hypothetical protein
MQTRNFDRSKNISGNDEEQRIEHSIQEKRLVDGIV